jgi:hypothetical protein
MIDANLPALQQRSQAAQAPFHDMAITLKTILEASRMFTLTADQKEDARVLVDPLALACKDAYDLMHEAYTATEPIVEPEE